MYKELLPMNHPTRINRRRFLQMMTAGMAGTALLSACAPGAAPAAPAADSGAAAPTGPRSEWVTGNIPADLSATFKYTGWEGEAEMRKWLLHFDNFFKENYPNVEVQGEDAHPTRRRRRSRSDVDA